MRVLVPEWVAMKVRLATPLANVLIARVDLTFCRRVARVVVVCLRRDSNAGLQRLRK